MSYGGDLLPVKEEIINLESAIQKGYIDLEYIDKVLYIKNVNLQGELNICRTIIAALAVWDVTPVVVAGIATSDFILINCNEDLNRITQKVKCLISMENDNERYAPDERWRDFPHEKFHPFGRAYELYTEHREVWNELYNNVTLDSLYMFTYCQNKFTELFDSYSDLMFECRKHGYSEKYMDAVRFYSMNADFKNEKADMYVF